MPSYQSMKDVGVRFTYVDKPHNTIAKFKKSVEELNLPHFQTQARSEKETKRKILRFVEHINNGAKTLRPKISDRLEFQEQDNHFFIDIKSKYDTSIPELVKYVLTDGGKQPFAKKSRKREAGSSKKGSCGDLGKRKCEKLRERSNTFKRHKSLCKEYDKAGEQFYEISVERGGLLKPTTNKYQTKKEAGSSKKTKSKQNLRKCKSGSKMKSRRKQIVPP